MQNPSQHIAQIPRLILSVAILLVIPAGLLGQVEANDDFALKVVELKQRIEKDESIAPAEKTEIATQIQLVEANLKRIEDAKKRIAEDQLAESTVAARSAGFAGELKKLQASTNTQTMSIDEAMLLQEVESEVAAQLALVEQLGRQIQRNGKDSSDRNDWRLKFRTRMDETENLMADAQASLRSFTADGSLVGQAKQLVLQTNARAADIERASISAIQSRYEVVEKENMLQIEHDLLELKKSQATTRLSELEKLQTQKRQEAAKKSADEAASELLKVKTQNPLLVSSYEINAALARRVQEIEVEALMEKRQLDSVTDQLRVLQDRSRNIRTRVDKIGLTGAIGAILRKCKSELPELDLNLSDANKIKEKMNTIQYELFETDQQRDILTRQAIRAEIEAANGVQADSVIEGLVKPIDELIAARKGLLGSVKASLDRLFVEILSNTELKERELADQTNQFREYINERILWIRSNDVLFSELEVDSADRAVFSPAAWSDALQRVGKAILKSPALFGLGAFFILSLMIAKPTLRNRVDMLGEMASRGSCATFWPTIRALMLSLLIAITIPSIFFLFGFGLNKNANSDDSLFSALSPAFYAVAWFVLPFEILRRICRPKGLANQHFDWSDAAVARLRHNVGWIVLPGAALVFAVTLLRSLDSTHRIDLIERSLFVASMLGLAFFSYRTFHPKHGVFAEFLKSNKQSWANQTSIFWFGLILLLPISLAVLAVWGYYFTAINLAECAFGTFVFALIAETVRELLKRLILVKRRNVHISAARRKHEAQLLARRELQKAQAEAQAALKAKKDTDTEPAQTLEPEAPIDSIDALANLEQGMDIDDNAKQANKLVSLTMVVVWAIGLWMIWTDVLPALKALDSYTIWPTNIVEIQPPATSDLAVKVAQPEAATTTSAADDNSPASPPSIAATPRITVGNLLAFFVISIITLISTRNLPSALEMLLLEHLPVDRSFRYALKSLFSYTIVLVGMILAFRTLSITWSSVQWLATALTFGLAFGLQEIFANFVAGIILMFERPIRIGDWITVDEFTGVVTKIRTRATTIVNWDRKEYVIPNKDFITGRLINWTLSDAINRIVIPVGIAYGSDVEKAKAILHDVCSNHPKTVQEPPTHVIFDAFGESSLNLLCRTFIGDIDSRPQVIDQLHTQINNRFIESGIEISFPQHDLHLRSASPEVGDLLRGSAIEENKIGANAESVVENLVQP